MFPSSFEYHRAGSVKEALAMLGRLGAGAKLLAGGHSLIPMMKLRLAEPDHLIDIGGLAELSGIREERGKVTIGAATTHSAIEASDLVRRTLPVLAECAGAIGDAQVRNRGTIGGSLAHADPAADYPAAVLALEAEIMAEGARGARTIKAGDFFVDLMTTALKPDEILTAVRFNPLPEGTGSAYLKHRQPASGFAIVGVAAVVTLGRNGKFDLVRVGITGLAAKAFRASAVEAALAGKERDAIAGAAAQAAEGVDALADIHASGGFRAELARVYTKRALELAASRVRT